MTVWLVTDYTKELVETLVCGHPAKALKVVFSEISKDLSAL